MKYKVGDVVKWSRSGKSSNGSKIVTEGPKGGYIVEYEHGWNAWENPWISEENPHLLGKFDRRKRYWAISDRDITGLNKNHLILKRLGYEI